MTVFSAFFAAIWFFYPRYRSISIGLGLVLAVALVATDYHFLSDVIAGAYLGLIATCLSRICFEENGVEVAAEGIRVYAVRPDDPSPQLAFFFRNLPKEVSSHRFHGEHPDI